MLNFILREYAANGDAIILWQRGNYHYEIERWNATTSLRKNVSQYLNTSCEQAKEIVERMCK